MLSRAELCHGKKIYPSYTWAAYDAERIRGKKDKAHSEVYRCRICQGWHVGEALGKQLRKGKPRPAPPVIEYE